MVMGKTPWTQWDSVKVFNDIYKRIQRHIRAYHRIRARNHHSRFTWNRGLSYALYTGLVLGMAVIVAISVAFLITYQKLNIASIAPTPQISYILYRDGSEMTRIIPSDGNRVDVTYDQIPQSVKDAIIAAEDRQFYTNPGFSLTGFTRALLGHALGIGEGSNSGGGSTISQQYIKNAVTGDEKSLKRKWNELVFSIKLTHDWSKEKIFTAYANTIYFGRSVYGVGMAAHAYFNKPIEKVTIPEAALLAALIWAPSLVDPAINPTIAHDRWNYVMDGLVDIKALTPQQRASYSFPTVIAPHHNRSEGSIGLIRHQVLEELQSLKISEEQLNTQGYHITTTIDRQTQRADVHAALSHLKGQPKTMRTAVVSIDPRDGGVRGYFGGINPTGFDYAQASLQTGSSFKVFALLAALEQGIPLSKIYSSAPYKIGDITIKNSDGETCGSCNLATALKMSLNTVYYRLMNDLDGGPNAVAKAAHEAGIAESFGSIKHTLISDNGIVEGGIVLGQYSTRVIDMASAYATIAHSGIYFAPHFIQKIVDAHGNVIYDRTQYNPSSARFSEDVANNTIAAMEPIAQYSRSHALNKNRPSAAKTGTTQLGNTGNNKDAWMIGFTPQLSTAVWVGSDRAIPLRTASGGIVYGSGIPADIWKQAMDDALAGKPILHFPSPGEIGGQAGIPKPHFKTIVTTPTITIGPWKIPQHPETTTIQVDGDGHEIKPRHSGTQPMPSNIPRPHHRR